MRFCIAIAGLSLASLVACGKSQFKGATQDAQSMIVDVTDAGNGPEYGSDATGTGSGKSADDTLAGDESKASDAKCSCDKDDGLSKGSGKASKSGNGCEKAKPKTADKDHDKGECASTIIVGSERIKVSGSEHQISMSSTEALAVKVTGNQNQLELKMSSDKSGVKVPGLCLFVAGNQNKVTVDVGVQLGAVYVKARGNQPDISFNVAKDAAIGALNLNFAGNGAHMTISGEGSFPCEADATIQGNKAVFDCKKP